MPGAAVRARRRRLQPRADRVEGVHGQYRRHAAAGAADDRRQGSLAAARQAQQGDPKATMAVIQIRKNPDDMQNILDKFFTAEEPEIPVAEQELLGGGSLPPQGPPPGIAQLLQGMGG